MECPIAFGAREGIFTLLEQGVIFFVFWFNAIGICLFETYNVVNKFGLNKPLG